MVRRHRKGSLRKDPKIRWEKTPSSSYDTLGLPSVRVESIQQSIQEALRNLAIDQVMIGEGEHSISNPAFALAGFGKISEV
jgi:hypothetical protein